MIKIEMTFNTSQKIRLVGQPLTGCSLYSNNTMVIMGLLFQAARLDSGVVCWVSEFKSSSELIPLCISRDDADRYKAHIRTNNEISKIKIELKNKLSNEHLSQVSISNSEDEHKKVQHVEVQYHCSGELVSCS